MITHQPAVVGLIVCRDVTRDPSGDYSISRSFTGMSVPPFPTSAAPFCVMATLTDGEGEGRLELRVSNLDDPALDAARVTRSLTFPDRLQLVECVIRVSRCTFPSPGLYLVSLSLDGEWLAQRAIRVYTEEGST